MINLKEENMYYIVASRPSLSSRAAFNTQRCMTHLAGSTSSTPYADASADAGTEDVDAKYLFLNAAWTTMRITGHGQGMGAWRTRKPVSEWSFFTRRCRDS
jgi:hypothetical protein